MVLVAPVNGASAAAAAAGWRLLLTMASGTAHLAVQPAREKRDVGWVAIKIQKGEKFGNVI